MFSDGLDQFKNIIDPSTGTEHTVFSDGLDPATILAMKEFHNEKYN